MQKLIMIDIDGVLCYQLDAFCAAMKKKFNIDAVPSEIVSYGMRELLTPVQVAMIVTDVNVYKDMPAVEGAAALTGKLSGNHWKIHIVTARQDKPEMIKVTSDWLDKIGIVYDRCVYREDKAEYCDDHRIPYAIEDSLHAALALSEVCEQVFLFSPSYIWYNKDEDGELPKNVMRVASLDEVWQILKGIT